MFLERGITGVLYEIEMGRVASLNFVPLYSPRPPLTVKLTATLAMVSRLTAIDLLTVDSR